MTNTKQPSNIVELRPNRRPAEEKILVKRWSSPVMAQGFTAIPTLLFRVQGRLGIGPVEFNVLLQIVSHWWGVDDWPYPSKDAIAKRISRTPRQVQRCLTTLEQAGLITRIERFRGHRAQTSNRYSLTGLIKRLQALAPEIAKEVAERAAIKSEAEQRGGRKLRAKKGGASPV
jgi:hypothetical protein